ncbi:MAG: prepilin peptidase [Deltaproteobacteria bacterium]|nr:prepilin peptidase [Deltaproteobacteria bacterium]
MIEAFGIERLTKLLLTLSVFGVAFFDWRERRIPNRIVLPMAGLGLLVGALAGWHGLLSGVEGLLGGFGLLLIPYLLKGYGAGDVKFLAAVGAFVGPGQVVRVFLLTLLCYPILAAVILAREHKFRLTLLRFGRLVCTGLGLAVPGLKLYAARLATLDQPEISSASAPFGVAISAGTLLALFTNLFR